MSQLDLGENLHRAYVGHMGLYDLAAAWQFHLLTQELGLREWHTLLEVGCGSLRVGRLLIPYLLPDGYCGLEPNTWLLEAAIDKELGRDLVALKRPTFRHESDFGLSRFGRRFDMVFAQSILSHTSQAQMRACMREAKAALEPEGLLVASWWEGEDDYEGEEWVYPESVSYRQGTVERIAAEQGLAWAHMGWPNPNGQRWTLFHHPERQGALPGEDPEARARAEARVQAGLERSRQRSTINPALHILLRDRLADLLDHPAVVALRESDPEVAALVEALPISGAPR